MAFKAHWRYGDTGWFPILSDSRAVCIYCKGHLAKLHGINKYPDNFGNPLVMGFFAFGTGPWCLHCGVKEAWNQKEFFERPGSNEYSSKRFDLNQSLRPKLPSVDEELRKA